MTREDEKNTVFADAIRHEAIQNCLFRCHFVNFKNNMNTQSEIPVIDIRDLVESRPARVKVAQAIGHACREFGFFYVAQHGVSESLQLQLVDLSKRFFAMDHDQKMQIDMKRGGIAWRGYFPVGGELTSGKPDLKEGIYFGSELNTDHPMVQSGTPLHGANLFPEFIPEFRQVVLDYLDAMTTLGHALMRGISLSLDLDEQYFDRHYTHDPLVLFRIFNYPPQLPDQHTSDAWGDGDDVWGVGEHTDYGVLTILKQDDNGGLQIKSRSRWIEAPPVEGTFVCNIGDMLERMTKGIYRSTPHRVRNISGRSRLSFPFFFDPNFSAAVQPIPVLQSTSPQDETSCERWDRTNVHTLSGTYGEYLMTKVGRVFPGLGKQVLPSDFH